MTDKKTDNDTNHQFYMGAICSTIYTERDIDCVLRPPDRAIDPDQQSRNGWSQSSQHPASNQK